MADDPTNWSKVKSSEGKTFYYNRVTKAAQWERPKMSHERQGSKNGDGEPKAKKRRTTSTQIYGVWNNKGGVGKTTLTYHLATHYAKTHPGERVLVIDMCPQANISSALLGFAGDLDSGNRMNVLRNEKVKEFWGDEDDVDDESQSRSYLKSISGYLIMRVDNKQPEANVDPRRYMVKVDEVNLQMPGNLYLLLGDETLELSIKAVEKMRSKSVGTPWKDGTILIKRMIEKYAKKLAKEEVEQLTVFIDTNPAFSVYTELAIAASTRLIIPLNADDFSRSAANAMLANIYGYEFNPSFKHPCFGF